MLRVAARWLALAAMAAAGSPFLLTATEPIRGRVADARTGEPLALVDVRLTPEGPGAAAVTDKLGRFVLSPADSAGGALPRLRATMVGYRPATIEVRAGQEFEILLQPDTLKQSDRVDVSAGAFSGEQELSVALAGNELRNLASVLADDPLRAVQSMPGVASNDDFRAQFALRGAGFQRIGVYLDGILIHAPFHTLQGEPNAASLSIIQGELLESANVHAGPLPARYADRTAGALDFRSREGDARRTSARLSGSASNAGASAEGPLGKRATWLAAARKSYLQYIINRTASEEPSLGFAFWDAQGKLAYTLTDRQQLSLTLIDGHSGLNRDPSRVRLGLNAISDSGYHYTLAYTGWRYSSTRWLATQRLGWLRERFENVNLNRTPLQRGGYREGIWNGDFTRLWSAGMVTEFGWSARALRDGGLADRIGATGSTRLEDYAGKGLRAGAYVQQSWSPSPRVQLRFGGRHDRLDVNATGVWLPNAGISLPAWRSARLHLAWSQTAQYPELMQLLSRAGRRTLQPERAAQVQISVDQALGERSRVRVELYQRRDRRLLFRPLAEPRLTGTGSIFNPSLLAPWENSLAGHARGGQIFFQRRSANGFTGWISYGYLSTRLTDGILRQDFISDFETRHLVQLYASQRLRPTVNLSGKWIYGTGMPIPGYYQQRGPAAADTFLAASRNLLRLPAYQRGDVRINKSFVKKRYQLTLFAEVINLTNHRNVRLDDYGGYDGRTGRARILLNRSFPILPSAGIVADF